MKKLIRIDFPPDGARCAKPRCPRPLKQVCYVAAEDGVEYYYGSTCVTQLFSKTEIDAIPDLTRRDLSPLYATTGVGRGGGTRGGRGAKAGGPSVEKIAGEYLWLRLDKLATFCAKAKGLAWVGVSTLLDKIKTGDKLSTAEVEMVVRIAIETAPEQFRAQNLLDIYAAQHQLKGRLAKVAATIQWRKVKITKLSGAAADVEETKLADNERYYKLLQEYMGQLGEFMYLSKKQVAAAKLELPTGAFAWRGSGLRFEPAWALSDLTGPGANHLELSIPARVVRARLKGISEANILSNEDMKKAGVTPKDVERANRYIADKGWSLPT